jgi:hypothetical protein
MSLYKRHPDIKWFPFWVDPYLNKSAITTRIRYMCSRFAEQRNLTNSPAIYALPETFIGHKLIKRYQHKLITFEIPYIVDRDICPNRNDILFSGTFYKEIRKPEPVLNLLLIILPSIHTEIHFHFYVNKPEQFRNYTIKSHGRILFYEFVKRNKLIKLLSATYMLINVGNINTTQMPSKVVEYISFRKPILFFYCNDNDASFRFLNNYPDVCMIDVRKNMDDNIKLLSSFINSQHSEITYDELMKNTLYKKSTPEYIQSLIRL